jgi:hypothetical protein
MHDYKFEFVTGCPGSSWSSITHMIRKHLVEGYDVTDLKDYRCHKIPDEFYIKHTNIDPSTVPDENKLTHFGSYFGPFNEYGQNFDCISKHYSRDEFVKECLLPFSSDTESIKQIKSHWFAYNLDWIWENFKGHHLLLIWKDPELSLRHWHDVGGWEITYPNYDWYQKLNSMSDQIKKEADAVLDFVERKNLQLVDYNHEWFSKCYPDCKPIKYRPPNIYKKESKALIKLVRTIIQ